MRQCFLHVGPHKTGSSSIQHFLFENRGILAEAGIYIPAQERDGAKGNHTHLIREFMPGGKAHGGAALAAELRQQGLPQTVVLSSEDYSIPICDEDFRTFVHGYFAELGYRVTVVCYIRPQVALINSSYTQAAKILQPMLPFEDYLERWLTFPKARNHMRRRASLIAEPRMDSIFVPFTFELTRQGLCEDFLRRIGVAETTVLRCAATGIANQSKGPKSIAAIRAICDATQDVVATAATGKLSALTGQLRLLMNNKGWNDTRFDGLHPADKDQLIAIFAPSNERFARAVWQRPWQDIFGGDEAAIRVRPRNVFDVEQAAPDERAEFESFCRDAVEFIRESLDPRQP